MRRVMQSLAFVFVFVLAISGVASAAPDVAALPTVTGVLTKLVDGEIVLKLEVKEEQRTQLSRMRQVENGYPRTPGGLGVVKGEVYVRYLLAPDKKLDAVMERLIGQKMTLELDRALRVQRLVNAP